MIRQISRAKKKSQRYVIIAFTALSALVSCKAPHQSKDLSDIQLGDNLVDVLQKYGLPEHQFTVGGFQDYSSEEQFGLQWDVNYDSPVTIEGKFSSGVTAWFDCEGRLVKLLVRTPGTDPILISESK